jgi:hypothetical protein
MTTAARGIWRASASAANLAVLSGTRMLSRSMAGFLRVLSRRRSRGSPWWPLLKASDLGRVHQRPPPDVLGRVVASQEPCSQPAEEGGPAHIGLEGCLLDGQQLAERHSDTILDGDLSHIANGSRMRLPWYLRCDSSETMMSPMDTSERIAMALAEMFRCYDCSDWKALGEGAYDVRWDADDALRGVVCWTCWNGRTREMSGLPAREVA